MLYIWPDVPYSLFDRSSDKSAQIKTIESCEGMTGVGAPFQCSGIAKRWDWEKGPISYQLLSSLGG